MKTLKVEAFKTDEAYYSWLKAREAGLRVSKYTPSIVVDDYSMTARIIVKYKRLDTAIKHAKEAFADYPAIVEALAELESRRVEDKHITGISDRYSTINARYSIIGGGYSFLIVHRKASEREEEAESVGETETETEGQTNEETKEETKMNSTSKKTLDRTAAIKTIFYHLACGGYGGLPRATELYKYLSCDGEIGLTREEIKRYMLENALCDEDSFDYSDEEIADEWFRFADEDEDEEETEIARETKDESVGEGVAFKSEIEEAQSSDDVHETNARLEIVKLKDVRFGTPHLYKSVTGYAFYDAKKGGYWAYSAHRDKHGILAPYTPCGGRETLEKILSDGGFTSFEGMEVVKPLE